MAASQEERVRVGTGGNGHLPGYAECHFCTVKNKRLSWRCVSCVGRLSLRERLARAAEERRRRKTASVLSLLLPGLGHLYRSSPGTGLFFLTLLGMAAGYFVFIEGEMTSGRWLTIGAMTLVYLAVAVDAARGPGEKSPPCQQACPAGLSCLRYVGLTREGKFREALELVEVLCPFPGTVGRVCHHPCEQNCRRGEEGEPIAICALKRYLADNASGGPDGFFRAEKGEGDRYGERVAVVGGGPSGLSAALYLRLLGFRVTVFEAGRELGGMPQAVIPDYRLPGYVYREEIRRIIELGVEVRTGMRLGEAFGLEDLRQEGFAAAYLALGAERSVRLPHCGTKEEGFLDGLDFLRSAKAGEGEKLFGNVLVIGGGNVAVDVAKTAVRLGGETVKKIFLESRETMPAHHWECEEAVEEGVELIPAGATISFEKKNGRVSSALCRKVERIDFDENGRIRPVLMEGTDFVLDVDWVVTAVGTGPDYSVLSSPPKVKPLRRGARAGRLRTDDAKGLPVVIGGDYFSGPASVIEAVAAGYEASLEIYRAMHKSSFLRRPVWNRMRRIRFPNYVDRPEKARRKHPAKVDPEVRCESFCEVCEVYDSAVAESEAARCMRCSWPIRSPRKAPSGPAPPVEPLKAPEAAVPAETEAPKTKEFF
jgi:NADPH-dependent glutamate synthase beta subunit-like oxidoreductase